MGIEIRAPKNEQEWDSYYDLRFRILREPWGQPRGSEKNEGDKTALHFALFDNEELLAVARMDKIDESQVQVRFVGVENGHSGKGLGKKIMIATENSAKSQGFTEIMLHARENAVKFYLSLNYEIVEESYLLFDTIQHYKMIKRLN